jgi:hypothetical protein
MGTIQPSIYRYSLRNECLYFDGFGHVGPDEDGFPTLLRDHMDGLLCAFFVHISNDEFRSLPSKREGSGSPDT